MILNRICQNGRERDRNAKLIIEMNGNSTTITNPDDSSDVRKFAFDYSYWSHDGAEKKEDGYFAPKPGSNYIGQVQKKNKLLYFVALPSIHIT